MRRTAVEEEAPMLEMTPVVAPGEDAKDEEAGEPAMLNQPAAPKKPAPAPEPAHPPEMLTPTNHH